MSVNTDVRVADCLQEEKSQTITTHIWLYMVRMWTGTVVMSSFQFEKTLSVISKYINFSDILGCFNSHTVSVKSELSLNPSFYFSQSWTNEFLTWNSSDFCGIEEITLPKSLLWIPDVRINEE